MLLLMAVSGGTWLEIWVGMFSGLEAIVNSGVIRLSAKNLLILPRSCKGNAMSVKAPLTGSVTASSWYSCVTLRAASFFTLFSDRSNAGAATDAAMQAEQTIDVAAMGSFIPM